jgi:sulfopyruvate decarboxylase alpha subunit
MSTAATNGVDWPNGVHRALSERGVGQVAFVPDAGLTRLIHLCEADAAMRTVVLTSEQEGIALAAGAWLGGVRTAVLMQSSGVGNIVNMLSLARTCRFPLFLLVTMRGECDEVNEWQKPMGEATPRILELAGVGVRRAERAGEVVEMAAQAARDVYESERREAVLIAQAVIGVKSFDE